VTLPPPIPRALARGSDASIALPPTAAAARGRRKVKARPELHSGSRAGAWKVERELGRGGMASVHAVVHAAFGKRAALKIAHASILGPQFTPEVFLREARIANLVEHPGVTDVFATGSFDGRPYMVMERLAGGTLGERLDRGPIERTRGIEILLELCAILGAAHEAGVVHRDLKLDNVFLLASPCTGGGRLKLLDWGVAAIVGEPDPLAGLVAGTLTYVAPEQVRGDDPTPASDIYSLAVLAYQVLLGQPPFASPNDLELIRKHLHDAPPAPSTLWAEIPADLEALLLGMLSKRAEDRPTLDEVVQVLTGMRVEIAPIARKRTAVPVPVRLAGVALAIAAAAMSIAAMW
jgi:serine/threonine protein kinase